MKTNFTHRFDDIISLDNILGAWQDFVKGKRNKADVQIFSLNLADNLFSLHEDLKNFTYQHGKYSAFNISDPKPRNIHKATIRDRLLHHAIYRQLYPFFDKIFISDSYSYRLNKGTHKAINQFRKFFHKVSRNKTRTCWVLKCDIKNFFANINHGILMDALQEYIPDRNILWLIERVVNSFYSHCSHKGLPLGNLTSQLLVNIYMNRFDQFVKHKLKAKYYIRYADDFVILSHDKNLPKSLTPSIQEFLKEKLDLELHANKVFIKTVASGIDFLGWVHFPNHRVLRTSTKRRMFKRIKQRNSNAATINSYLGLLSHGNTYKIRKDLQN